MGDIYTVQNDAADPPTEQEIETDQAITPPSGSETDADTGAGLDQADEDEKLLPFHQHPRFQELIAEKNALQQRLTAFETLQQDPKFARSLAQAAYEAAYGQSPPEEDGYSPPSLPEDTEFESKTEESLYGMVTGLHKELYDLRQQFAQGQQTQAVRQQTDTRNEITRVVNELDGRSGISLSESQREKVRLHAYGLALAYEQEGREITLADALSEAYPYVAQPLIERAKQVTAQKQKIAGSGIRPVAGATTPGETTYESPQDAMEDAFRLAFPDGLPR